jgi:putative toxin-antitoxin system antitoxin component (TIGR02293 family)
MHQMRRSIAPVSLLTDVDLDDHAKMANLVSRGMDPRILSQLSETLGFSVEGVADIVAISRSTIVRRTARHQLLNQEQSERVLRFLRLYRKALSVFKTKEVAINWFQTENRALGDKTPLEFSKTEPGARLVENILGRISEGVFS